MEEYLNPQFNIGNIDRYFVRKSILEGINEHKKILVGNLIDVGCGIMPYKSLLIEPLGFADKYFGLDFKNPVTKGYEGIEPDLYWDGNKIPLKENFADSILLTEVLEHCFDPALVLNECQRVLKSGGNILITVPFVWPLHDIPYDAFRYTPFSIEKFLKEAGFNNIQIKALGGWNASLGQMMGLWLNRSGIFGWKRKILYYGFFKWFIKWLYKNDHKPENFFDNSTMYTGLIIHAKK